MNGKVGIGSVENVDTVVVVVPIPYWIGMEEAVKGRVKESRVYALGREDDNMNLCFVAPTGKGAALRDAVRGYCNDRCLTLCH